MKTFKIADHTFEAPVRWTDNQSFFDSVVERLFDGRGRAVNRMTGICAYNQSVSGGCAIGSQVPTEVAAVMDGLGGITGSLSVTSAVFDDLVGIAWPDTENGRGLAERLQWTHDSPLSWQSNRFVDTYRLKGIAEDFNLTYELPK